MQCARGAYTASVCGPDFSAGFVILSQYQDPTIEDTKTLNKLNKKDEDKSS